MNSPETKILFPKRIAGETFEDILRKYYKPSLFSTVVKFELSYVEWCDLFELSLITLWIKELVNLEKKILFFSPQNEFVKSFLAKYEFGRFLAENGILSDLRYANIGGDLLQSTPYFPLKFHHEESFKDLLTYLSDKENYRTTFSEMLDSGFVNKEHLRNVIIGELGDNMFRHGKGIFASNAMAKFGDLNAEKYRKIDWRNSLIKNSSPFEKQFFEKLNGNEYFTIIFSDKGPGIFETLKQNFIETHPEQEFDECEVLEYAFFEHSTSRTIQERLGDLAEIYENFNDQSGEPPVLPPPTGLYLLLNIVRQYYGFIYVRSGHSIIAYDFYNDRRAIKNRNIPGFKRLADFKGTQIKIHFPVNIKTASIIVERQQFLFPETEKTINYKYLNIGDYFTEGNKDNYSTERNSFIKFYQDIDNFKTIKPNILKGVILDLAELKTISTKALYLVIAKLMNSQEKNFTHVLVNIPPQLVIPIKEAFSYSAESIKPIILFDINYKREIIGVNYAGEVLFGDLFSKDYFYNDVQENSFIAKHDHLFIVDNAVSFKHKRKIIFNIARISLEERLRALILDKANKIFYPDARVLLPSRKFCEGYFDIGELIQFDQAKATLKQWATYLIFEKRPTHLVTIGRPCSVIIKEIIKEREIYGPAYTFKHIAIYDPNKIDFTYLYNLGPQFFGAEKALIFCDVIGTAETLIRILRHIPQISGAEIISIINSTTETAKQILIRNKSFPIEAIVVKPILFHDQRPNDWKEDYIFQVNPLNNSLIKPTVKKPTPIWSGEAVEEFVSNVIIPDNKYLVGHFTRDQTHITYLLDIPLITKVYGDVISKIILLHFKKQTSEYLSKIGQGTIVYFKEKTGLREIIRNIATTLLFATETIPNSDLYTQENYEGIEYNGKTIIVIEDAFDSGNNLLRLIDLCVRKKAARLYVYTLFKRGSDYSARRLSKIDSYGGTKIHFFYLAEIDIPTYDKSTCPICRQRSKLNLLKIQLKREKGLQKITNLIENELIHTEPVNLRNILEDHYSFERSQTVYNPDDITYRIILENSANDLVSRDYIVSKINTYKEGKNLQDVLLIFKIIVKEQMFDVIDKKIESDVYEYDFKTGIIRVCLHCLRDINQLEVEDLDVILQLFIHVDEDGFLERLNRLIRQALTAQRKLLIIFKHLFLANKAYNYPQNITNSLKIIGELPDETAELFEGVMKYWEQQLTTPDVVIIRTLDNLKKCNHEIQHHIDLIKSEIKLTSSATSTLPDLNYLLEYLNQICINLRELGEFDFHNSFINNSIYSLLVKLRNVIEQGQTLMALRADENYFENLNNIISDIGSTLYSEESNLSSILNLCATNLSTIIIYLLRILEEGFKEVKIELEEPDVACIAFGDKNGIESIFHNILNNIPKHALASKVLIKISVENDDKDIVVRVFDNGVRLHKHVVYNIGLTTSKDNCTRYFGKFTLTSLTELDHLSEDYNKVAAVTLKYVKEPNKILS